LDKKADPPFVAARNRRADLFIPRIQQGVKNIFDAATAQVALFAKYEARDPYSAELQTAVESALYTVQKPFIFTLVSDGYTLATTQLTTKKFDRHMFKKNYDDMLEPISGRRGDIEEWLVGTAKREASEHAKKIKDIHEKARTYWDEKLGRGMTPAEIAHEILVKGYAYDTNYANLISRTNTIWAMNEGAEIKYIEAGITRERWLATDDDVRCVYCMDMDGTEIRITDVFLPEGGRIMHPEIPDRFLETSFAVAHPPLHPYCRCCVVPVIESISIPMRG
jgi:hypothetical protein